MTYTRITKMIALILIASIACAGVADAKHKRKKHKKKPAAVATAVQVAGLYLPGALLEIHATAELP